MANTAETWQDEFLRLAGRAFGHPKGQSLLAKYQPLLSKNYISLISPRFALKDILHFENLRLGDCPSVGLLPPLGRTLQFRLHFYSRQDRYLDSYIPILENLHFRVMDQVQFVAAVDNGELYIRSFTVIPAEPPCTSLAKLGPLLMQGIQAVLTGKTENDPLNKLILLAGLNWQAIDLLRAYRNYYSQLGFRTTRASLHRTMVANPVVAASLYRYFEARFKPYADIEDPLQREERCLQPIRLELSRHLEAVSDLNDDRILRTLFNLIDATLRCNYFARCAGGEYFIAFKIDSLGVFEMTPPKPLYEIYVHAAWMQGIHLRAGKVSRGGIRWSDRPDDFRSEILGLMQTQVSKNALIVPTGAKGGFIVTNSDLKGGSLKEAGKRAYITLIEGMLDLTDNYDADQRIVHPKDLVYYDDPDPYLVVAADKGTAQFSDIANQISANCDFWLGDAFASGGSHGYNHKTLGITARGAWECVKRHFRELGKDIQAEAFTVVGVGSMDGDVFGNGMLLSPYIRLRAAFSGLHIFLDPEPPSDDSAFRERRRLFELPGSTWDDYDRAVISPGGGVYSRTAKDIALSPEIRKWLGIRARSLDGETLIRNLLTAETELLWFGGIGCYVKGQSEKHEEVGDRANDNVRVDACELRAQVVGEGANLAFTQKARVEFGLNGGRINTDAVDNSAGVDTSDHEVNLKILLSLVKRKANLAGSVDLFQSMTESICKLVLFDNYAQSRCLSMEQIRAEKDLLPFFQVAERLEAAGFFESSKETFPDQKEIRSRPGRKITRPEFAILTAAAKMYLTEHLLEHSEKLNLATDSFYLNAYFPEQITEAYRDLLPKHPLADKIKATVVSNKLINQAGCRFLLAVADSSENGLSEYIEAYLAIEHFFAVDSLRDAISLLDSQLPAIVQYQCLLDIENAVEQGCRWLLFQRLSEGEKNSIPEGWKETLDKFWGCFKSRAELDGTESKIAFEQYLQKGLDNELALRLAFFCRLGDFMSLADMATKSGRQIGEVWSLYRETRHLLGIEAALNGLASQPIADIWENRVNSELVAKFAHFSDQVIICLLTEGVIACGEYFTSRYQLADVRSYFELLREIGFLKPTNQFPYLVLASQLEKLADSLKTRT